MGAYANDPATSSRIYNQYVLDCESPFGNGIMIVDLLVNFEDVKLEFLPVPSVEVLIEDVEMACP